MSTFNHKNKQGGFIALISTLIVSLVFFLTVVSIGNRGLMSRFLLLDIERKAVSEELAGACVQVAILEIVENPGYTVSASPISVPVGPETCTIVAVTPDTPTSGMSFVQVSATSSRATTNLQVVVDTATAGIVTKEEVPTL